VGLASFSSVPIISVGWNFEAKWRACGNAADRNYVASSVYRPIEFLSGDRPSVSSFHRAPRHFFLGVDINLVIQNPLPSNRRTFAVSDSRDESYRTLSSIERSLADFVESLHAIKVNKIEEV